MGTISSPRSRRSPTARVFSREPPTGAQDALDPCSLRAGRATCVCDQTREAPYQGR